MKISERLMVVALATALGGGAVGWREAGPGYTWEFPRDHAAHREYRVEWWYLTGHVAAAKEREFGYQLTFFRIGLAPHAPDLDSAWAGHGLLMAHAAITDKTGGRFLQSEVLYRETPFLAGFGEAHDPRIAWSRAAPGTDSRWELRWNGEGFDFRAADDRRGFGFELRTRARAGPVFQGPGGLSRRSREDGAASLYYSFPRMATRGTVTLDGRVRDVEGASWMDHEFGTGQLGARQVGWDWFAVQLDDGRELMLFHLRDAQGGVERKGGTVIESGRPTYLAADSFVARAGRRWKSPATGTTYPVEWTIELPQLDLRLELRPYVDGQEVVARLAGGLHYWEGAVEVRDADGRAVGRGYVELTGYGRDNRPPL